jgi:hypothetical protein
MPRERESENFHPDFGEGEVVDPNPQDTIIRALRWFNDSPPNNSDYEAEKKGSKNPINKA